MATGSASPQLGGVGGEALGGEHVAPAVALDDGVVDVGADGEGEVGRQRPRRRRPGQQPGAGPRAVEQLEADRQRRVLAIAVDVVHPGLGVAQRRLAAPAVGQHPEALVDQALVPQRLERPHDALHVVEVEGLVVVVEVDPAGLALDVALPLVGVAQHARAAGVVELGDAVGRDLRVPGDAELLLGLDLGRQAVAVPPEAARHDLAAHRAVARHGVLDEAGQQVAVVRQAVGERRAVVEHELVGALAPRAGRSTRRTSTPAPSARGSRSSRRGKSGCDGDLGIAPGVGVRVVRSWLRLLRSLLAPGRTSARRRGPRYHPACAPPQRDATRFRRR